MKHELHGMCHYPEYKAWLQMKQRCNNKNSIAYKWYGARGIKVCDEWLHSFKKFIEDVGRRPDGRSLDRIDTNGNYCKENCRWATKLEQANNTRDNRTVKYKSKMWKLRGLSDECGVKKKLLEKRLFERGWSVDRAVINKSFIGRNQHCN